MYLHTVRVELSLLHEIILRVDIVATNVAWEICPKCRKKSHGEFEDENGLLQVYAADVVVSD